MKDRFSPSPQSLCHVYRLAPGDGPEIVLTPLAGGARFEALRDLTYNERFLDAMGLRESHFRVAAGVAATTPVTDVRRPNRLSRLEELADRIERDLGLGEHSGRPPGRSCRTEMRVESDSGGSHGSDA